MVKERGAQGRRKQLIDLYLKVVGTGRSLPSIEGNMVCEFDEGPDLQAVLEGTKSSAKAVNPLRPLGVLGGLVFRKVGLPVAQTW